MSGLPTEVACHPGMITVLTSQTDGGEILSVYRSVVARTDGATFRPARELLASRCSTECVSEEREDRSMIHGRAVLTTYMLWDTCPAFAHDCCAPVFSKALVVIPQSTEVAA